MRQRGLYVLAILFAFVVVIYVITHHSEAPKSEIALAKPQGEVGPWSYSISLDDTKISDRFRSYSVIAKYHGDLKVTGAGLILGVNGVSSEDGIAPSKELTLEATVPKETRHLPLTLKWSYENTSQSETFEVDLP